MLYQIKDNIKLLSDRGLGVLITDHNPKATLSITDRAYLVFEGQVLKSGTPEELANDDVVRSHYLGSSFELRKKEF